MLRLTAKFAVIIFVCCSFYIVNVSIALDGKGIYLNKCGACHKGGGQAKAFAPTKYASTQWNRFFRRDKHKRKKDITDIFTDDEVKAIIKYLCDHAADSDQPEAVGLR